MVGPRATCGSPPLNSMRISRRIRSTTSSGVARLRNSGYRSNRVISSWSCDRLKISIGRDDLVVVKRDPLQGVPIWPEDDDSSTGGELPEPFGHCQGIQHCGPALQFMAPWPLDLPDHGNLDAMDFSNDDRNFGC